MEYTLRNLQAKDLFVVSKLIDKIGFKELKGAFQGESIRKAIEKGDKKGDELTKAVGLEVMFDVASIVISHLSSAEEDIYMFVSSVSNIDVNDVRKLGMADFAEIVIAICTKQDFMDFIKVASKLLK